MKSCYACRGIRVEGTNCMDQLGMETRLGLGEGEGGVSGGSDLSCTSTAVLVEWIDR